MSLAARNATRMRPRAPALRRPAGAATLDPRTAQPALRADGTSIWR